MENFSYSLEGKLAFDKIHHANNERSKDKDVPNSKLSFSRTFRKHKVFTDELRDVSTIICAN